MKRLLVCLLATVLLFTFSITVSAVSDGDDPSESLPAEEATESTEPEASEPATLPNEADLPDGYEIDPNFSLTVTLDDDNDWRYSLKDLLSDSAEDDEYIYFFIEENVADDYTPYYSTNDSVFSKSSPGVSSGNVVIVKNLNEGESPVYELPQTGGIGTTPYTAAGIAILLIAAVYGIVIYRRKRDA